jgi:nanoRNase/pAp phosphatase (c-di-AMP/oligoRNAs hydrolase)
MLPPDLDAAIERARPKLEHLRELAHGKRTLLAQTHDYPDPDTIASALALTWLLQELEGLEPEIGYGGIIGRAENKAMIKVLGIKMRRTSREDFDKYDLVALLDTQPEVGNHSVPNSRPPDIVFDHHFKRDLEGPEPAYFDVGGTYGATSTKVLELVLASGLTPPTQIATALFYGVKSDTRNLARQASSADLTAYLYLLPLVDTVLLSEIEHPQVPLDYFRVFNKAIMRAKIYGNMLVADLGVVYTPDLCAEVADRMLQVEGMKHAVATAWFEESLFLSLRTRSRSKNAGRILHNIVTSLELGTAGGHGPMAGARIPMEGRSQRARADIRRKLIRSLVAAFGQDFRHFQRMVNPNDASVSSDEPPPPRVVKDDSKRPGKNGKKDEDMVQEEATSREDSRKEQAAG